MVGERDSLIESVETWYARVPLVEPIVLGAIVIPHRDFVVVRLRTAGGLEGVAYSLTRGAPIDLAVSDLLASRLIGRDALESDLRHEELSRSVVMLGAVGVVGRAVSLVDVCVWDIKAKAAGLPLWQLLGGYRSSTPVVLVAPYAGRDEGDLAYAERLLTLSSRGYEALKLYPLADPGAQARRLTAIRRVLGGDIGLMVDMAWSWRTPSEAIAAVRSWESFGLAWVEDPFPPEEWRSIRALARAVETPIAAGDEVSVEGTVERLIGRRAIDVLRMDVTSIGGFTRFAALRETARAGGYRISTHAYPEIHRHCVFAWRDVLPVEIFPPGSRTWGTSRFLRSDLDLDPDGSIMSAPREPGLGLDVDWEALEGITLRRTRTPGEGPR
jgi:L-alanine-DL-glutamate epimerase-like enolase superfamily enzyme